MLNQIDLVAFANYAINTFDYSPEFEDDAFAVTFDGVRVYVERKCSVYNIHVGAVIHKLPRC